MKITGKQIKKIYAMARQGGLDDVNLHAFVYAHTGSDSIGALTKEQGIKVIDGLNRRLGFVTDRATKKQVWQILKLCEEIGWMDNPKRLRGFLEKRYGVSHARFLPKRHAREVIEALKAMSRRMVGADADGGAVKSGAGVSDDVHD